MGRVRALYRRAESGCRSEAVAGDFLPETVGCGPSAREGGLVHTVVGSAAHVSDISVAGTAVW